MAAPFQYEYHDTPIHYLNPMSKLLLFGVFLFIGQIFIDPIAKIPVLIVLIVILWLAKLPFGLYKGFLIAGCFAVIVGRSYTAIQMVDPELFKVYPHELVSIMILPLTPAGTPILGRTALTVGTLLYWCSAPFAVIPVILAMAGLLHTTSMSEIVSVLSRIKAPFPLIFMVTVGLRFIPDIVEKIRMIQKAQALRGWTSEGRNPIKKVKQLQPVLVPLVRSVITSVDVISMGSKNRAFGLGPVTQLADFGFTRRDKIVSIGAIVVCVVLIIASVVWKVGSL